MRRISRANESVASSWVARYATEHLTPAAAAEPAQSTGKTKTKPIPIPQPQLMDPHEHNGFGSTCSTCGLATTDSLYNQLHIEPLPIEPLPRTLPGRAGPYAHSDKVVYTGD